VYKRLVAYIWVVVQATSALVGQNPSAKSTQQALQPGLIVPHQTCTANPDQSYALYLPSHYTPDKRWPIVYAFDPDGRGNAPVDLMKDAAERYGYIVVGSNNSRNGSWKVEAESGQAMWDDTHAHLAIDDRRVYFAGFSGGARVAALLAQRCKCVAGVLLSGAGFAGTAPSRDAMFAVFAAVGTFDFNYPELSDLDEKLEQAGFPHVLRHFDGPHEWAPAEVMDEALAWFRLVAMKQNREPRDDSFVTLRKAQVASRAQARQQSGDSYEAWHEYRQAIATFDGLTDTAALQQAALALAQQKDVRDGAKRENHEFQEQKQITGEIYSGLVALRNAAASPTDVAPEAPQRTVDTGPPTAPRSTGSETVGRSDILHQTEQRIIDLRERTASEKHQDKLRIYRRALTGVFIASEEFGEESLTAKNFAVAKDYFQLATEAKPDSVGALESLATARASDNDRKGTFEALRRAKEQSKDHAAFSAWLNQEPAFDKLREDPQFRALLANP
jgi:pimeloyl-ACP methyl ester carboxylesterase